MTESPTPVSGDAMPIDDVIARLRDIAANRSEDGTWYAANGGTQEATTEWIAADLLERLRSQGGAPEGWKLVPVEPTPEMIAAWRDIFSPWPYENNAYYAMLSSAPQPPTIQSDADEMIDQLNVLCEDFGCEAGTNRLHWLHEQLSCLKDLSAPQPPEVGTGWPELPCRFSERGCTGHAVGIFHVPQGCHCWPDPIQALCAQHACKADSPGPIECVIDFSCASPPGQDDRIDDGSETDGSLNQSLPSALPRKDVEGAAWAVIKQLRDGEWCSSACLTRGGCGCADAIQTAIDASVSAEHSRVIDAAMKIAAREQYADWEPEHPLAKRVQSRIVEGIRDLGKQTGGAE